MYLSDIAVNRVPAMIAATNIQMQPADAILRITHIILKTQQQYRKEQHIKGEQRCDLTVAAYS